MKVHNRLSGAGSRAVSFFSLSSWQPMEAEKIAIFGENNMLFVNVPMYSAEILKVFGLEDFLRRTYFFGKVFFAAELVEDSAGPSIEPVDHTLGEK